MEGPGLLATSAADPQSREGDGGAPPAVAHEDLGATTRLQTERG